MKRSEANSQHFVDKPILQHLQFPLSWSTLDRRWQHLMGEARTRILLWYVLILGVMFLAGIPAFRYLLFHQLDERVSHEMTEESRSFQELLVSEERFLQALEERNPESFEYLKESIQNSGSHVVPPRSVDDLKEFFSHYLRHSIPADNLSLIHI